MKYPQVGVAVAADWRTTARILRARAPAAPRAATARFSLRCGSVVVVATALTPWRLLESVAILHAVFVSSSISCIMQQSNIDTSRHFLLLFIRFYSIVMFLRFTFSFRTNFSHFFINWFENYNDLSMSVNLYFQTDWLIIRRWTSHRRCT